MLLVWCLVAALLGQCFTFPAPKVLIHVEVFQFFVFVKYVIVKIWLLLTPSRSLKTPKNIICPFSA